MSLFKLHVFEGVVSVIEMHNFFNSFATLLSASFERLLNTFSFEIILRVRNLGKMSV